MHWHLARRLLPLPLPLPLELPNDQCDDGVSINHPRPELLGALIEHSPNRSSERVPRLCVLRGSLQQQLQTTLELNSSLR